MLEEMKAIEDNGTWELVEPPAGYRPIGLKWVYKLKRDERGAIVKYKARFVARGFVQREGIDFEEVFAPVARMESVRLLLAMATAKDWRVHHLDIKSAFLNGKLAETIFVKQALGFAVKGAEHKVLKLRNAFYGLRQALRAWNTKLDATLGELEFTCCATEHALYTRRNAYLAHRLLWLRSISEISCEMIIGATFFYGWYCRYSSLMLACFDTLSTLLVGRSCLNASERVQRIVSLKNLTPFRKGFLCEEKECESS
jgi:hypothetical protein